MADSESAAEGGHFADAWSGPAPARCVRVQNSAASVPYKPQLRRGTATSSRSPVAAHSLLPLLALHPRDVLVGHALPPQPVQGLLPQ